jgi:CHASE2 domain-containing sensor protein
LNKNSYIQIALRGKNFCDSSKDGFEIIWSNPLRYGLVGGAGAIIMFIGKLLISSATTAIMWSLFTYSGWSTIISPLLPLLVFYLLFSLYFASLGLFPLFLCQFTNYLWIPFLCVLLWMKQIKKEMEEV